MEDKKRINFKLLFFVALPITLIVIILTSLQVRAFTNPTQQPPNGTPGPIPVTDGGTGSGVASGARANLGAAASGANTDITSLEPSGNLIIYPTGDVGVFQTNPGTSFDVGANTCIGNYSLCTGNTNEIWTQPNANSGATLYINYRGYQAGFTQYRNLWIGNGEQQAIIYVGAGASPSVDFYAPIGAQATGVSGGIQFTDGWYLSNDGSTNGNMVLSGSGTGSVYFAPYGTDGTRITPSNGNVRIGGPGQTTAVLTVTGNGGSGAQAVIGGSNGCGSQYTGITLNGSADTTCGNHYNILSGTSDQGLYLNTPSSYSIWLRTNNSNDAMVGTGGVTIYSGGLTFPDGTTQTTAAQAQPSVAKSVTASGGGVSTNITTTVTSNIYITASIGYVANPNVQGETAGGTATLSLNGTGYVTQDFFMAYWGCQTYTCYGDGGTLSYVVPNVAAGTQTVSLTTSGQYIGFDNTSVSIMAVPVQ